VREGLIKWIKGVVIRLIKCATLRLKLRLKLKLEKKTTMF
jgi:hypothetical protein